MKLAMAALLVLAFLPAAALADCWSSYATCSRRCCDNVGGTFTEESDSVYCSYGSQGNAYYSCDTVCVRQELDCIAPGSSCSSQYATCTNNCGGPGGSSCNDACSDRAFDCADTASSSSPPSSGCCGGFILLFAGVFGLALFARRVVD